MDFTPYLQQPDLLKQTADQLIKDFRSVGIEITFSGNPYKAYEELSGQVEPHIDRMVIHDRQKFITLLYRIDLSETQIQKAALQSPSRRFPEIITDLILKRELQKVVIRNYYSK